MPILPLPQFEADLKIQLDEEDRKTYEALKVPKSLVVRFGFMKLVGEFPYDGQVKPGCGSKVVVRTHRGTEVGEMLTSTCPNSSCSKSVSRQEMLQYIQNSGGRDYPFFTEGRVLRLATSEDLDQQSKLEQSKHETRIIARDLAGRQRSPVKIVEVEPILGNEVLTIFYASEERVELRDLYRDLSQKFNVRVDLKHVGARDEARLTADYEKCGQYCCCKNFLKVLKPVSMKSAKIQKATLDPLKISGRCGRLMCCLRYEDQTYDDLRKRLPRRKSRVGTPEGDGLVMDTQILTQLALVELDDPGPDGKIRQVAVAIEDLTPPVNAVAQPRPPIVDRRDSSARPPRNPGTSSGPAPTPSARSGSGDPRPPQSPTKSSGGSADPTTNQPRREERPPRPSRDSRDSRDQRPPLPRQGPSAPRPANAPGPRPPANIPPKDIASEVDDLLDSIEDDWGDAPRAGGTRPPGPSRPPRPSNLATPSGSSDGPNNASGGSGDASNPGSRSGPDGQRRRRRRRGRGGPPQGPGGPTGPS